MGSPLILLPAHIALLHLIIEPASSIAFEVEPASKDIMKIKPRSSSEPLFGRILWYSSIIKGITIFLALTAIYFVAIWRQLGENDARALVFCTLILSNTFLIYLSRGENITIISKLKTQPNQIVKWITIISLILLSMALYIPFFQKIFHFSTLHLIDILLCISFSFFSIILSEIILNSIIHHLTNNKVMKRTNCVEVN